MIETGAGTAAPGSAVSKLTSLLVAWHARAIEAVSAPWRAAIAFGAIFAIDWSARRERRAAFIRERLSTDTWRLIGDLNQNLSIDLPGPLAEAETFERADAALRTIAAISGLAQENMNRGAGWRVFDTGRRIERGVNTCRFARHFASGDAPADDLDVLLDLVDSRITYRSRYLMGVALLPVRDMVVLTRSIRAQFAFRLKIDKHLETLPLLSDDGMLETPRRLILQLRPKWRRQPAQASTMKKSSAERNRLAGARDRARYL
jgi:uncharacterized alpha-E superfamily protein